MAEHHHVHQHVKVSDDGRTVAAAEVIISGEPGGTARVRTPLNISRALVLRFCRLCVRSSGMILSCRVNRGWIRSCWTRARWPGT